MRKVIRYAMALFCLLTVAACSLDTVYSHYRSIASSGLDRCDTLLFDIPPLSEGGNYQEVVGLRITDDYPYTNLVLIVDQTAVKSGRTFRNTLECQFLNQGDPFQGGGVSHRQYTFPLTTLPLVAGDSLHITVRHGMKREVLPGITDVGMTLTRQ